MKRRSISISLILLSLLGAGLGVLQCTSRQRDPLVVLFCLDGATFGLIDDLRAAGRLPTMDRLIRAGTAGLMQSVQNLQIAAPIPKKGFFSPVVWTTIATGKAPEKHGILDFTLPIPGSSAVWAGGRGDPPRAVFRLQEIVGSGPFKLKLRLRSYDANGAQKVSVRFNEQLLGNIEIDPSWRDFPLDLPPASLRPVRNSVELTFERQSSPAAAAVSGDRRQLAASLGQVDVYDAEGHTVTSFDPMYNRFDLKSGFHLPEAQFVDTQSSHMRARPFWDLLGERGHESGIIGWWVTWPATPVRGYLVSSHMGLRGEGRAERLPKLTWPDELTEGLFKLLPTDAEVEALIRKLYPVGCMPTREDKEVTFRRVVRQDEFFYRIAKHMIPTQKSGLISVYFESIDVGGHDFLPYHDGRDLPPGCPESVRGIVPGLYDLVDGYLGELMKLLPEDAIVVMMSDHGMQSFVEAGQHYPFGILSVSGPNIRRGEVLHGATVFDVAPTVMHLFGEAIPLDMDGKLLVQLFEEGWLRAHPARYRKGDDGPLPVGTPLTEATEEMLERLRGIGYIE